MQVNRVFTGHRCIQACGATPPCGVIRWRSTTVIYFCFFVYDTRQTTRQRSALIFVRLDMTVRSRARLRLLCLSHVSILHLSDLYTSLLAKSLCIIAGYGGRNAWDQWHLCKLANASLLRNSPLTTPLVLLVLCVGANVT